MGPNNLMTEEGMRELSDFPCPPPKLEMLKRQFDNVINSKRTLERMNNVRDLITVLRKRDELHKKHMDEIAAIINFIPNSSNACTSSQVNNCIAFNPRRDTRNRCEGLEKAYNEILQRLGSHWIDLARSLDIPENLIDNMHKLGNDKEAARETLDYHEMNCDPHIWRQSLLNALDKSRRKDLSMKVASILDRFNIIYFQNCYL